MAVALGADAIGLVFYAPSPRSIGAEHRLIGPPSAEFNFVDLASRERWTLRFWMRRARPSI